MSDLNSVIVRKAYEDFAQGNIPSVFAVFDAGITWHVPGHSPLHRPRSGRRLLSSHDGAFRRRVQHRCAQCAG